MVFATVKGDVHDIGKNIVSIVLACNNYEVIDLGVMVPAEKIIQTVREEKPDLLCLSGLITPSLEEMVHVTEEMQKAGLSTPIMVGGATTSKLHTALKIAPHYDHPVIHVVDASQNPLIAAKLLNPDTHDAYVEQLSDEYERLRRAKSGRAPKPVLPFAEARAQGLKIDWAAFTPDVPHALGLQHIELPVSDVATYINWVFFFTTWRLLGRYADLAGLHDCPSCRTEWLERFAEGEEREKASEAMKLFDDAQAVLRELMAENAHCRAAVGLYPAVSEGDTIRITGPNGEDVLVPVIRQQSDGERGVCLSLADFIIPATEGRTDYIGAFAVTVGNCTESLRQRYEAEGDSYRLMLLQTLSDRLAEASAECLHVKVRRTYWGYAPDEDLPLDELFKEHFRGIRPAVGYPSLPDQDLIFTLDRLVDFAGLGITPTENGALYPTSSAAGFYFAHPDSRYFSIARIGEDQLADYAERRGKSPDDLRRFLQKVLEG